MPDPSLSASRVRGDRGLEAEDAGSGCLSLQSARRPLCQRGRMRRVAVLIVIGFVASLVPASPARAHSTGDATLGMPFSGRWANHLNTDPATHGPLGTNDWVMDL